MVDFTIGINASDGEIGVTIILEDREETLTIEEAECFLTSEDRQRLEQIMSAPTTPQKHVWRARIVLLSAAGRGTMAITRQTGKSKRAVWCWQDRFVAAGVAGLLRDKIRPGRVPPLSPDQIRTVVEKTLRKTPADATHWSTRTMARAVGLGKNQRSEDLVRARAEAASDQELQGVARSRLCRQTARHCRIVPEPARARAGARDR
jgi:transposase